MALLLALARNVPQAHASLIGGAVGALEVLRRRAVREDARDPRLRADRTARRPPRARVRHARDRLRPVRRRRALPRARRREGRVLRRRLRGRRLHHAAPAQDPGDRGLARRRGARQVQGRRADPQRRPRPAGRRRGPQGGARLRQGRRRGARRVPLRAGHRPSAVRLPERDRHARTSAPRPPRRPTAPATRPPSRWWRRSPAAWSRARSTCPRSRPRTWRCSGRSCRSAARSAGSPSRSPRARRSTASQTEFLGRIAERDTRLLSIQVLLGVLAGHTEEEVNEVNAPTMAEERGIEVSETKRTSARDYTDLVRVTVSQRRAARARGRHADRPAQPPAPARGLGPALRRAARGPPHAVPLPRRARDDRTRRHGLRPRTASTSSRPRSAASPTRAERGDDRARRDGDHHRRPSAARR